MSGVTPKLNDYGQEYRDYTDLRKYGIFKYEVREASKKKQFTVTEILGLVALITLSGMLIGAGSDCLATYLPLGNQAFTALGSATIGVGGLTLCIFGIYLRSVNKKHAKAKADYEKYSNMRMESHELLTKVIMNAQAQEAVLVGCDRKVSRFEALLQARQKISPLSEAGVEKMLRALENWVSGAFLEDLKNYNPSAQKSPKLKEKISKKAAEERIHSFKIALLGKASAEVVDRYLKKNHKTSLEDRLKIYKAQKARDKQWRPDEAQLLVDRMHADLAPTLCVNKKQSRGFEVESFENNYQSKFRELALFYADKVSAKYFLEKYKENSHFKYTHQEMKEFLKSRGWKEGGGGQEAFLGKLIRAVDANPGLPELLASFAHSYYILTPANSDFRKFYKELIVETIPKVNPIFIIQNQDDPSLCYDESIIGQENGPSPYDQFIYLKNLKGFIDNNLRENIAAKEKFLLSAKPARRAEIIKYCLGASEFFTDKVFDPSFRDLVYQQHFVEEMQQFLPLYTFKLDAESKKQIELTPLLQHLVENEGLKDEEADRMAYALEQAGLADTPEVLNTLLTWKSANKASVITLVGKVLARRLDRKVESDNFSLSLASLTDYCRPLTEEDRKTFLKAFIIESPANGKKNLPPILAERLKLEKSGLAKKVKRGARKVGEALRLEKRKNYSIKIVSGGNESVIHKKSEVQAYFREKFTELGIVFDDSKKK